jgi:hypothetical protein
MKFAIACLGALMSGFVPAAPAFAQESPSGDSAADEESPPPQSDADPMAQVSAQPPLGAPPPALPPPPPPLTVDVPQGQWVYQADYGWIWIPAAATAYFVGVDPYAYLYTPVYGWTWYLSPWGAGAYRPGPAPSSRGNVSPRAWVGGRWVVPAPSQPLPEAFAAIPVYRAIQRHTRRPLVASTRH